MKLSSSKDERQIEIVGHIVLAIMTILALIPFWLLIAASFSENAWSIANGYQFFPQKLSVDAYAYIARQWDQVGRAYLVTILVTVLGTAASLLMSSLLAFGLSKEGIPGGKLIFALILITMLFSGGIVPQYMIYNNFFHIKNTLLGLIVPNLLMSGFSVILMRNYFRSSIPPALIEAMTIDGANPWKVYLKLIVPLSAPIFATLGVMSAVTYWNDWTNGLYYITDAKLYSVQQLLNEMNNNINFLANNSSSLGLTRVDTKSLPTATMRLAIAVVAILPVTITYPFFQKYFVKGITMGAVKG